MASASTPFWGIRQRNPEWLTAYLEEMNRIKPDSLLIAEASARDEFYFEQGFDAAYDWTDELGRWAWRLWAGSLPIGKAAMVDVLTDGGQGYRGCAGDALPQQQRYGSALRLHLRRRFLSHRTGDAAHPARAALPLYGRRRWRRVSAVLPDRSDRRTDHELREDTKKLIARRSTPALHSREWLPLAVEPRDAPVRLSAWQ